MKALRIVLGVVAAVLVIVIVAAVILVSVFDPNEYKDRLTAYVQERTGRTLTIDDDIQLSLFPWFAIETGGLALSDDPAYDDSFVTIDTLSARVRVWPLLRRRVEIGRIVLDGINVNLHVGTDGQGNWAGLRGTASPDSPSESAPVERPRLIEGLAIAGIDLNNTHVRWHDANGEVRWIVSDLALATGAINDTDPVELTLELSALDVASQATAELALTTTASYMPTRELRDSTGTLRIFDSRDQQRAETSFSLETFAIDGNAIRMAQAALVTRLTRAPIGPELVELAIDLEALEFDSDSEHLAVNGLEMRTDAVTANWNLSGDRLLSDPSISGSVAAQGDSIAELARWLDLAPPRDVDLAGLGAVGASTDFSLRLEPVSLNLSTLRIPALGADLSGTVNLNPDGSIAAQLALARFTPDTPLKNLLASLTPDGIDFGAIGSIGANATLQSSPARDRIEITDYVVSLDSARLAGRLSLSGVPDLAQAAGSVTATGVDQRLFMAIAGNWLPEQLSQSDIGAARLSTDFRYTAASNTAEFDSLRVTAYGLNGDGRLTINGSGNAMRVSGQAQLDAFSPRELLARFDMPVPQSADPTTLGNARLAASFATSADDGQFRDIVLMLDDSRITGDFRVENFANPSYTFALSADAIDVDRYLPRRADAPAAATGTGTGTERKVLGEMQLSNDSLMATRVRGSASVGQLRIGGMQFNRLSTVLNVGDGRAELSSVQTELYGGTFTGSFLIDATGDAGSVQLTGNADSLAMRPLFEDMLGAAQISGTGTVALNLAGRGNTVNEALQSAAGSMSVAFHEGTINGINIGRELCAVINTTNGLPAPPAAEDATAYSVIRASATVTDGVATTSDLYATTGYLDLTGSGRIRLADQWLDTDYVTRLTRPIPLPGCEPLNARIDNSIPIGFWLKGQLPDPDFGFDIKQLIEDWARRELRNRVEDAVLDRLRDALR